jgi:hypothetical protein
MLKNLKTFVSFKTVKLFEPVSSFTFKSLPYQKGNLGCFHFKLKTFISCKTV